MTPTSRSLAELRATGWTAGIVERWIPGANIRADLFGVIDLLAIRDDAPVLAVQATSGSNVASRVAKAKAEPRLKTWLKAGCTFEVWGWSKRGPRGKRKTWQLRRVAVGLDGYGPDAGESSGIDPTDSTPGPENAGECGGRACG